MSEEIRENKPDSAIKFTGKVPPQFHAALKNVQQEKAGATEQAKLANQKDPFADLGEVEPSEEPKMKAS
ncbi:MAG: hypothetical protein GTO02_00240, partial [Candidatus Dadabacteria bacterium]|nr:hypothetical protein [Candidatus Dadabacteria bacterium]